MKYVRRKLEQALTKAAANFPILLLTGPRGAGKTVLLQHAFPRAEYHLMEDPDVIGRVKADPRGFLDEVNPPVILDEIQHVPELFNYIRSIVDRQPQKKGQWLLTGSQEASLMKGVTESMAGRAAVFNLFPFSGEETEAVGMLLGGFPEVVLNPKSKTTWFRSYIQTYLERDVRQATGIKDLATFRRFLTILASRTGRILNRTDLAAPLGVSVPTISAWIDILEITGHIIVVPPFYENLGKRLIKSPKLYFCDSGLVCHMLGIEKNSELNKSPFKGQLFEGLVASEIIKKQINANKAKNLYYFRDRQGLEVDFLVPKGSNHISLVEAKASATVVASDASRIQRLAKSMGHFQLSKAVVHIPGANSSIKTALAPGIRACSINKFIAGS